MNVRLRSRLSVNTIDAAIDAGLSCAGLIRALSYQVVDFVRSDWLTIVLDLFEPSPPPVHLVYDTRSRFPLKLRVLVDFVTPAYASDWNRPLCISVTARSAQR